MVVAACGDLCVLPVLGNFATLMLERTVATIVDRDLGIVFFDLCLACWASVMRVGVALRLCLLDWGMALQIKAQC